MKRADVFLSGLTAVCLMTGCSDREPPEPEPVEQVDTSTGAGVGVPPGPQPDTAAKPEQPPVPVAELSPLQRGESGRVEVRQEHTFVFGDFDRVRLEESGLGRDLVGQPARSDWDPFAGVHPWNVEQRDPRAGRVRAPVAQSAGSTSVSTT